MPASTASRRPGTLSIALRAPVAMMSASKPSSVPSASVTVRCSGSIARTDPVTLRTLDSAVALGRMATLSRSRQPRMTHGKVKPRKWEKSSSTTVISTPSRLAPESESSLTTLSPPTPAPRISSFLLIRASLSFCRFLSGPSLVLPLRCNERPFHRRIGMGDGAAHGCIRGRPAG